MAPPAQAAKMTAPILHGYWRSSAAYRVRIALNLKGIAYPQISHDLRTGSQAEAGYRAIAPIGLVPALEVDGQALTQSLAILEWLDERYPEPALLPDCAYARAQVRAMAAMVACDVHPLNNLRVLKALKEDFGVSEEAVQAWVGRWIGQGFAALETMARGHGNAFCFGNTPTLADCCLTPQIYNARRFAVNLAPPTLIAIDTHCAGIAAFVQAAPERQPDAGPAA